MYRFWESIIEPLLASIDAHAVVEIGVADGKNTKHLLDFVRARNGILHAVDPAPRCDTDALQSTYGNAWHFLKELSLNALPDIAQYDAVLIDGDHNWYTVYNELLIIEKYAKRMGIFPLVLLHDIGWPYARRDLYYDPDRIPVGYRNAYLRGGILPSSHEITQGHGMNAECFHSIYETNVRNGVLTAIEDFIEQTSIAIEFLPIPGNHGIGILASRAMMEKHPKFAEFLSAVRLSPEMFRYIDDLETERLGSYVHERQLQKTLDQSNRTDPETENEREALKREQERLESERTALAARENRLHALTDELHRLRAAQSPALVVMEQQRCDMEKRTMDIQGKTDTLAKELQDTAWLRKEAEAQIKESQKQISWAKLEQERSVKIAYTCRRESQDLGKQVKQLEKLLEEREAHIQRILNSKSWRITAWLKHLDRPMIRPLINRIAYSVFRNLKDLWSDFGEPCPGLARFVRHTLLGTLWPVQPAPKAAELLPHTAVTVAVIIPCHNYAQFLPEAVESVLAQTVQPTEILVVDDASEDGTPEVARRYATRGVRYLRGDWRSVGAARNAGIAATSAAFLIFLDADDILHSEYIRLALDVLHNRSDAGLAYGNQQFFGDQHLYFEAPAVFDWKRFDSINHLNASAVVRRTALQQAGGFSHGVEQDGDWVTWRRILRLGWNAVKFEGTMFYRSHAAGMTAGLAERQSYPQRAGFFEEEATLFLSLSGRAWAWPKTAAFLEKQTFPHDRIHLVILDTSQDEEFTSTVRRWLEHCDYRSFTLLRENVGPKGLADAHRSDERTKQTVAEACARIYNRFARNCTTTLAFVLEDDVIPPLDVYARLIGYFRQDVATVSGCYYHRNIGKPVAWTWDTTTGLPAFAEPQTGVTPVGGNGFGCLVVRGERLRHTVFHSGPPYGNFDHNFYHTVTEQDGQTALLDWDCVCEHLQAP
ncbi:glycosyltransferase [Candidatus Peregrinibacteria bacterium]|nr:glycosyltransferase [Candidatus Peregrinibacteria bacterium]